MKELRFSEISQWFRFKQICFLNFHEFSFHLELKFKVWPKIALFEIQLELLLPMIEFADDQLVLLDLVLFDWFIIGL